MLALRTLLRCRSNLLWPPPGLRVRGFAHDSFMNATSCVYIEGLFNLWKKDPDSVHPSWAAYFADVMESVASGCQPPNQPRIPASDLLEDLQLADHQVVTQLIATYQDRGHAEAKLDPLQGLGGLSKPNVRPQPLPSEHRATFLKEAQGRVNMETVFRLPPQTLIGGRQRCLPLCEIASRLEAAYCGAASVQYLHLSSEKKRNWVREHFEPKGSQAVDIAVKRKCLFSMVKATGFESFLDRKFPRVKRFGIEGGDIVIPALLYLIDRSMEEGADMFVLGMAHRGRLNVLANVLKCRLRDVFATFLDVRPSGVASGDVRYHLGGVRSLQDGRKRYTIVVMNNPSHLEAVNPVVLGRVRAEQDRCKDCGIDKVVPILIHGDAAFAGQGVGYECLQLSQLADYSIGGGVHLVVDNQVGFTATARDVRSSLHCTDIALMLDAPIFHANADVPEAVLHCCSVAAAYRRRFHEDVFIHVVAYRRRGHNEGDEPSFTQPVMYRAIKAKKTLMQDYVVRLVKDGVAKMEEVQEAASAYDKHCDDELKAASEMKTIDMRIWNDSPAEDYFKGRDPYECDRTAADMSDLKYWGLLASDAPPKDHFKLDPIVEKVLKARRRLVEAGKVDWATAEAMAIVSLLNEGYPVRFSGQDVERGTFMQRHHVLHHQETGEEHVILHSPKAAPYTVVNSPLSECAVLAFELGYSACHPDNLVLWEAQFGDFLNSAQVVIDTMVAAGEAKWGRQTGIVLLCPHGMDGRGPEHSSGHLSRFLLLCSDEPSHVVRKALLDDPDYPVRQLRDTNMVVVNITSPGNLFHVLRRQVKLPFRKPLVVMGAKGLILHPLCVSPLGEMSGCTEFQRVIADKTISYDSAVVKHILCSGKFYYDLLEERKVRQLEKSIALTRIEQLSPFPWDGIVSQCQRYPYARLCWAQEEHKNYGAWSHVLQHLTRLAPLLCVGGPLCLQYAGRESAAAASTGLASHYRKEQERLLEACLAIDVRPRDEIYHL